MNERIRELAEQARKYVADAIELGFPQDQVDDIRDEKFAELIVKECCQAFETEVDTWKQMDPYQGGMKRAGTKAIKQHFGVEE